MKKLLTLTCTLILTTLTLTSCAPKSDTLTVAMELSNLSFESIDEDGNPIGVSVDIAQALADYIDKDLQIITTSWNELIPTVQSGKADIIISSMSITQDRKELVDFSNPYARSAQGVLINANSHIKDESHLNQPNTKIILKTGTTGETYAKETYPNATFHSEPTLLGCVEKVASGEYHAFVYDQLLIYRQQKENPQTTKTLTIASAPEDWGIAIKKGNTRLKNQINDFIDLYSSKDGFTFIGEKYLQEEKLIFEEIGFLWFFD